MTVPDSKIELVRKLLAKAESTDSQAERDALNERASQLITTYGIEDAMLSDAVADQVTDISVEMPDPYALDWRGLMWGITRPLRVKAVATRRWNYGRKTITMRLFGFKNDVAYAEILFASLRNQAIAGMTSITSWDAGNTTSDRKTYISGFAAAVESRLEKAAREAVQAQEAREQTAKDAALLDGNYTAGSSSVALVLRDRTDKVEEAVAAVYPKLGKAAARNLNGSRYSSGYRDGQKASLSASKSLGNSQRSLSR